MTKKKKVGRPYVRISQATRYRVKALASYGVPHELISRMVGVALRTLERRCAAELSCGKEELKEELCGTLVERARNGNDSCLIFACKTLAGLRETQRTEHSGPDGGPLQVSGPVVMVPPEDPDSE